MNEITFFFLTGNFLTVLRKAGLGIILALAVYQYYRQQILRRLITWSIGLYLGLALAATAILYYVWSGSELTKIFLNMPLEPSAVYGGWRYLYFLLSQTHGYFLYQVLGLYWLPALWSVLAAGLAYGLLRWRGQNQSLGLLAALAVGWPGVLIFLVLTAVLAAGLGLYRKLFFHQELVSLDQPILAAAVLTFVFGDWLLRLF